MPTPGQIKIQISELIGDLITIGLASDQRSAFQRQGRGGFVEVTLDGARQMSVALRDRTYEEIYQHLVQERAYNVRLLDGALIQMMYTFSNGTLQRHRLAFFPAPHLEAFQNRPDVYLEDEIHADIVARNIVRFPLRFDYDVRLAHPHPKSHLTLGQYEHCRIPVTAPLNPARFIDFILRNFYQTASATYADGLPTGYGDSCDESILPSERQVIHVVVPDE